MYTSKQEDKHTHTPEVYTDVYTCIDIYMCMIIL